MADESLSKNFEFRVIDTFAGYVSSFDKTKIAENVMVAGSQNIYKKLSGNLSVREGMKRRGSANTTISPISSEFVWNTSWGATYPLMISDSNLWVEYNGVWYSLLDSLTKTRYVFDKWYDITEHKDRVLFVKGDSDIQHWSGGIAMISTTGTNSLTKTAGTISWQQSGFSTTTGEKKIMIDGTEYTYTGGETTDTLTGVTPDPSAITADTIAIQSVLTEANTPMAGYKIDFIKVLNNQVYNGSYSCRLCLISANDDFTDYTVPTPRAAGDPELLTLDGSLKGIGVRNGNAFIGFGSGEWAEIKFADITIGTTLTQQTIVDVKPVTKLGAPYAHEFIGNSGNNIVYLAQDNQVRTLGDFNNSFTQGYASLSQEINTELSQLDFTGGHLKCIGDFIYLTCPIYGKTFLYQVRQSINQNGEAVAERLWHSPMIWNITRVDEIDGITYGFSNSNPQIYQLWDTNQWHDDSPSDENLPYSCVLALGYRSGGRRQGLQSFDKVFSEGYITAGSILNLTINYEYQGGRSILTSPINNAVRPAFTYGGTSSNIGSLGDESLGMENLGDAIIQLVNQEDLPKFKVINTFSVVNVFEYQLIYSSDQADARWELLATGTNARREPDEQANYIINKLN
jgi:hypothetical protein